ncbi:MAG: ester cyclase [Helicobacteraceae bacterium]|nr:ester cyclase [Candidatus Sulfurimonas ponti]MBL6973957.1 ester cyclase [Sulfurimonas sp.]
MTNNKNIVQKYYEMWNSQEFKMAESILSPNLNFHGSIGIETVGIEEFKEYAKTILSAFPNLYHATEIIVGEDAQVAVYVTYIGTHQGKLFDYEPTNNRINYSGASFFTIRDGKITNIKVLGDRYSLYNQISA